jgi:hypothetical protein
MEQDEIVGLCQHMLEKNDFSGESQDEVIGLLVAEAFLEVRTNGNGTCRKAHSEMFFKYEQLWKTLCERYAGHLKPEYFSTKILSLVPGYTVSYWLRRRELRAR